MDLVIQFQNTSTTYLCPSPYPILLLKGDLILPCVPHATYQFLFWAYSVILVHYVTPTSLSDPVVYTLPGAISLTDVTVPFLWKLPLVDTYPHFCLCPYLRWSSTWCPNLICTTLPTGIALAALFVSVLSLPLSPWVIPPYSLVIPLWGTPVPGTNFLVDHFMLLLHCPSFNFITYISPISRLIALPPPPIPLLKPLDISSKGITTLVLFFPYINHLK